MIAKLVVVAQVLAVWHAHLARQVRPLPGIGAVLGRGRIGLVILARVVNQRLAVMLNPILFSGDVEVVVSRISALRGPTCRQLKCFEL